MPRQELTDYLQKCKDAGYRPEEIRDMLVRTGWPAEEVDSAIDESGGQEDEDDINAGSVSIGSGQKEKREVPRTARIILIICICGLVALALSFVAFLLMNNKLCGNGKLDALENPKTCCLDAGCPGNQACTKEGCTWCEPCHYAFGAECRKAACCDDSECDDQKPYTPNYCVNPGTEFSRCYYSNIPECQKRSDCDDGDSQTVDLCMGSPSLCIHSTHPIPGLEGEDESSTGLTECTLSAEETSIKLFVGQAKTVSVAGYADQPAMVVWQSKSQAHLTLLADSGPTATLIGQAAGQSELVATDTSAGDNCTVTFSVLVEEGVDSEESQSSMITVAGTVDTTVVGGTSLSVVTSVAEAILDSENRFEVKVWRGSPQELVVADSERLVRAKAVLAGLPEGDITIDSRSTAEAEMFIACGGMQEGFENPIEELASIKSLECTGQLARYLQEKMKTETLNYILSQESYSSLLQSCVKDYIGNPMP